MKILESQSAILTNFEVYQHMLNQEYEFKQPDRKRKVPRSVQSMVKEVSILFPYSTFQRSLANTVMSAAGVLPYRAKPFRPDAPHLQRLHYPSSHH